MDWQLIFDGITALGSIATPILVLILTGFGWTIRQSIERNREYEVYLRELEEKLREDRIAIYNKILEPFIILFTSDAAFQNEPKYKNKSKEDVARNIMLSVDYKQTGFKLALIGSDDVITAYNDLMQYFYSRENADVNENTSKTAFNTLNYLGKFLLEIRKSMGNRQTKLDNLEMLEWMMKDIKELRKYA